jgi:ribosomal protein S18 acetylase RimI-like enzyme
MLRDLRKADVPEFNVLITREFPREGELLGIDAAAQGRIVAKVFQPIYRLIIGFARLIGKPIVRMFVVEAEGRVAATAVLTFGPRSGYIGAVSVDPAFRRRGFGRKVIGGCATAARATGKEFVTLDVLRDNTPAVELYRSSGYLPLRNGAFLSKDLTPRPSPLPLPAGARALLRSDRRALAALAAAVQLPEVARVLPIEPSTFALPPAVVRLLESETEAWVLDDGAGPVAFVRATVSHALIAGNLTTPILASTVSDERAREFLRFAESWIASKGAPRVIVERWEDNSRAAPLLASEGYVEAIPIQSMYLPLHG